MVCLLFVILIIGIVELFPYEYDFPKHLDGEVMLVEGKVSQKEIKEQNGQTTYLIYLEQIVSQSDSDKDNFSDKDSKIEKLNNAEGIICYFAKNSFVPNIGSNVLIRGTVSIFDVPDNPGEFDAPIYYKIKGIDLKMYDCRLEAYQKGYNIIAEKLFRMKTELCHVIDKCFKAKYRDLAKAILLGMSGEIDEGTKELYQRSGMLHILCVSGLHISILGMGLYNLLKRMKVPEFINTAICILLMLFYGTMIGMGTSVVRAILMFAMRLIAKLLKRTYDLLTASCVGIFLILFEQPLYIYHSGFLLSFLSVIALGAFRPIFPEKICKIDFINKRADSFFSSLTVWIVTLPVYGRFYYEVSISGLLLNVLILPFVSVVLVLVIGVCVLGQFYIPFGAGIARICEVLFGIFETIFEIVDRCSDTTMVIGYMSLGKCLLYYLGLVVLLWVTEILKKRYLYTGVILLCVFLIVQFPKELTITCLSVGQGDSAVIEYGKYVCVIDAGSSSEKAVSKYTILPFLRYSGIREVDYLFLTHGDSDHTNGVAELLVQSRYGVRIKQIVVTDGKYSEDYGEIFEMARELKIPVYEMKQGDVVNLGEVNFRCLSPSIELLDETAVSNNEISMVLLLEKEEFSMLFTGDTEGEGEHEVTKRLQELGVYGVTALKVSHHGSKNSTTEEFLGVVSPRIGIISCGENNFYGHPHRETIERLNQVDCKVLITKESGAVTIRVGEEIELKGYKE